MVWGLFVCFETVFLYSSGWPGAPDSASAARWLGLQVWAHALLLNSFVGAFLLLPAPLVCTECRCSLPLLAPAPQKAGKGGTDDSHWPLQTGEFRLGPGLEGRTTQRPSSSGFHSSPQPTGWCYPHWGHSPCPRHVISSPPTMAQGVHCLPWAYRLLGLHDHPLLRSLWKRLCCLEIIYHKIRLYDMSLSYLGVPDFSTSFPVLCQ